MNINYECVPDCGTDNCSCNKCIFYGGMSHGAVRCLAEESVSKAEAKPVNRRERKKKNGSKNQSRDS